MKTSIAVLLASFLCACSGDREAATTGTGNAAVPERADAGTASAAVPPVAGANPNPGSNSDRPPLAILRQYLDAWNAHDELRAASFLTPDSEYFDAAFAGKQSGREDIARNAIGVFLRGMPDLQWQMRSEPIVGFDGVAYEWTLTGTHTGTWGGVAPTGQKVSLKGMSFVRFRGDRISYQAVVYDSATLNRQLGL